MGSKARLVDYIAGEINNIALVENINEYYEPFCGGCAIVENINIKNRYASDLNRYLIALIHKLQETEMFEYPDIDREKWNHIRSNKEQYPDWLVAYAGLFCSFNGRWFSAWGGDYIDKDNKYCNKQLGSYNSLCSERKLLKEVKVERLRYTEIGRPHHAIIYCDAPYIGTKQYEGAEEKFDFNEYYAWLKDIATDNLVFISEYRMPYNDFKSIKVIELNNQFGREFCGEANIEQEVCIEQLFIVRGGWLTDKYYPDEDDEEYDF